MDKTRSNVVKLKAAAVSGIALTSILVSTSSLAGEWRGFTQAQYRSFFSPPAASNTVDTLPTDNQYISLMLQPEYYSDWDNGNQSFTFVGMVRVDEYDQERSHNDIREFSYLMAAPGWEFKAGASKVFWGVTESRHLVDIVNQIDFVENPSGDDKLGQPMVSLNFLKDYGTFGAYLLPYFRERTYRGSQGRIGPLVDVNHPIYEAKNEQQHGDWAVRYSNSFGPVDMGVAHFEGTNRQPILTFEPVISSTPTLRPRYDLIEQTSLDAQATLGPWIIKTEMLHQGREREDNSFAFVGGTEYTFVGLFGSKYDITLFNEYLFDDREQQNFQNDIFMGTRFVFNDAASTELRGGVIQDMNGEGAILSMELSRRFANFWKVALLGRMFDDTRVQVGAQEVTVPTSVNGTSEVVVSTTEDDTLATDNDDYIQLTIEHHF